MRVKSNQKVIAERVEVADTFFKRFKGLMGRKSIDDKAGMLFYGCSSIHSFFMRFLDTKLIIGLCFTFMNRNHIGFNGLFKTHHIALFIFFQMGMTKPVFVIFFGKICTVVV